MTHQTSPCPTCGHPVTTYIPDPWPKAVHTPKGREVVVKNQAELEALEEGWGTQPEAEAKPEAKSSPAPVAPKPLEIPKLDLKSEAPAEAPAQPGPPPIKPKATAP